MKRRPSNPWCLFAFALSGLVLNAGCGSSGSATAANTAACVSQMLTLAGELDGQPVSVQLVPMGSVFQQGTTPHTFDVSYAAGALHLEWSTLVPIGGTTAATGTIVMPAGTPHAGETICAGNGTTITDQSTGGTGGSDNELFTLQTLSSGPSCPGAALAGSIDGCLGG
jgi:hypothetical protein